MTTVHDIASTQKIMDAPLGNWHDDHIKKVAKQALQEPLKGILSCTENHVVSCDFNNANYFITLLILELALLSLTTLSSFLITLAIAKGDRTYGSHKL